MRINDFRYNECLYIETVEQEISLHSDQARKWNYFRIKLSVTLIVLCYHLQIRSEKRLTYYVTSG